MLTLGVDLAAEAANTAVAAIDWTEGVATVTSVVVGAADADIVQAIVRADVSGIDCPFGWPDTFIDFVSRHRDGRLDAPPDSGRDWRRGLAFRRTDEVVHELTGRWPLSVATDRIGLAAMRAAAVLAQVEAAGLPVDRGGRGRVVEVYPAGALRTWGLPATGYKGGAGSAAREGLVESLQAATPWLHWGGFEGRCRASDDALDAVLCALVARAHALGLGTQPVSDDRDAAGREGWIVLPMGPLADLA